MTSESDLLTDATIVTGQVVFSRGWLFVVDGMIEAVGSADESPPAALRTTSLRGGTLLPGFIDIHVHGGGGASFGADVRANRQAIRFHLQSGTTSLLAGISSRSPEDLNRVVATISSLPEEFDGGGRLLGLHLEGPFISDRRRGAHDPRVIRAPDPVELQALTALAPGRIRLITAAPELEGFSRLVRVAAANDVTVSAGHTDASGQELLRSVPLGVQSLTHTFNGMRPTAHRDPGPLQAVVDSEVMCELICDGIHVHPAFVRILRRLAGPNRVVLVTDAVAWAGSPDGEYQSGDRHVEIRDGRVVLAGTQTLAGSTLTMARAVKRYWQMTGAALLELAAVSSGNAARLLGEGRRIGQLSPGFPADVVVLDGGMDCVGVMTAGRWVRFPGAGLGPVAQVSPDQPPAQCVCADPSE